MAREVNQLLHHVFAQRRKGARTDLEAVESALRAALHQAGAAALTGLLRFEAPAPDQRRLPCGCGHCAQYQEVRSKPVLAVVGSVQVSRPYYLCPDCHASQCPADVELDVETAEAFGKRLYREAWQRGWSRTLKKGVMGDGAEWILNLAAEHFPGAIQIVDLYHARQHLWELARRFYPHDEGRQKGWMKAHQKRRLDQGKIEKLVGALRALKSGNLEVAEKICTEADYFERNAGRMRDPQFRRQHLFVGSGVIEAGCKTVIGCRFKRSGMFWTIRGANAILALPCSYRNGRFEDYWEGRRSAIAA
ncbi:MAG: hypothetical protein ACRD2G_14575 [Terriglobia bacterium]